MMLKISSFKWDMVASSAPRSDWVRDQIGEACFEAGRRNSTGLMWKHELLQPLWLSLGCFSELGRLSYLIWKRGLRATCWYENQDCNPTDRYFMIIFWYSPGSANSLLHFGLSLCNPLKQIRLSYIRWKGTSIAFIWGIVVWSATRGCTDMATATL